MLRENSQKNKNLQKSGRYKKVLKKYIKTYMDQAENEKQLSYLPVRKAMEYVENNYMDKIGLEEIAEYVGLNASYFSALLKESGKTFLSYLTEIRINHAKEFYVQQMIQWEVLQKKLDTRMPDISVSVLKR